MLKQVQIQNGIVKGEWQGNGAMPIPPDASWIFLDVTDRSDVIDLGMLYDATTDTFSPAPPIQRTRVSKSQVISVLTPQEWASANNSADPDVVWGMAQFQLADYVDLADPRFSQIMGGLVAKGILTQARANEVVAALQALANA
jgi:hypothetical protein